jgi:hypothetical protein
MGNWKKDKMKTLVMLLISITINLHLSAFAGIQRFFDSPTTLTDIFPLTQHLHYSYQYREKCEMYDTMIPEGGLIDSGIVQYIIIDSTKINDTLVVWDVQELKSLWHQRWGYLGDTTYWSNDTVMLSLQEIFSEDHEIRIPGLVWNFPLGEPDQSIYRYEIESSVQIVHNSTQDFYIAQDTLEFSDSRGFYYRKLRSHMGTSRNGTTCWLDVNQIGSPVLDVNAEELITQTFSLEPNYPNPFNPSTTIRFHTPDRGFTSLRIYDILGREVTILVNEILTAGEHEFRWDGRDLQSGVYFARLSANGSFYIRKLILMR